MKKPDIVFLGTPEFAVPSLEMLHENGYTIKAVITQPDRPKGRGHKMVAPPVKEKAQELGIPVYQFESLRKEGTDVLRELAPDLMITVAYGQILSKEILAIPAIGCINVHGSLLPKYRGAAPIEYAVINGEKETGVTTMFTVRKLDAGDILLQDRVTIPEDMTGGELREKLSHVGAGTLLRTLKELEEGTLERIPQNEEEATFSTMLDKDFGKIDFTQDAWTVHNLIRGCDPEPQAYFMKDDTKFKVLRSKVCSMEGEPGKILLSDPKKGLVVACGKGSVEILILQYPGSRAMDAKDFLRGRGALLPEGDHIG
ncbi:MAG: methionyl-tRNA formyltransferase [Clostridia bacterium]|nr:methionyl-tRNA formyltransferase [Clostridia bacterium]